MATYDLPTALIPQMASFGLQKAGVQFRSPFNGTLQSLDLSAERWACSLTSPPRGTATAGAAEAFLNVMAGGINKVRVSHPFRPVPLGTLRGSSTIGTTAAIGATTLVLADADNDNYLTHTESFDHANWTKTNVTATANAQTDPLGGTTADRITETTATGGHYVSQSNTVGAATGYFTLSVYAQSSRGWVFVQMVEPSGPSSAFAYFQLSGSGAVGTTTAATNWANVSATITRVIVGGASWYRCTVTAQKTNAATTVDSIIGIASANGSASYAGSLSHFADIWGAKLERATAASTYERPTLLAGDMFGAGSQLFQVASNTQSDDSGGMTVSVVNRVRAAISSGSAVTWNKPTADFVCPAMLNRSVYRPGYMEGAVLDLEESF